MKTIAYLVLSIFILASCSDMNELHQKYLDGGEIVYIGIPDSIKVSNGYERIQLEWEVNSDPKINSCLIYWNERKDSLIVPIENSKPSVRIPLSENNYNFELIHRSNDGTLSLTKTTFGISYGDEYRSTLNERPLEISQFEDSTVMKWGNVEGCIGVNLTYTTESGSEKTISIGKEETETVIYDNPYGGELSYESLFLPEEGALDTIPSNPTSLNFPSDFLLSKKAWKIDFCSSQDAWSVASNIIDDDPTTNWHSKWDGGKDPVPHIIIIDMQENKTISSLELARQLNNSNIKDMAFEISTDNINWIKMGELTFPNTVLPNSKVLVLPNKMNGRYLKVIVVDSNRPGNPDTSISEIYVTGSN